MSAEDGTSVPSAFSGSRDPPSLPPHGETPSFLGMRASNVNATPSAYILNSMWSFVGIAFPLLWQTNVESIRRIIAVARRANFEQRE